VTTAVPPKYSWNWYAWFLSFLFTKNSRSGILNNALGKSG
jgi:hypothetical protein